MAQSIQVCGMRFSVRASVDSEALAALAGRVEAALLRVKPQGPYHPRDLVLAAIALAHDLTVTEAKLYTERALRLSAQSETRDFLRRMLARIDGMLEATSNELPSISNTEA